MASLTFSSTKLSALEGEFSVKESPPSGATISVTFSCTYWATVTSVSAVNCYVNKQDKTSTLMPSGSVTGTGTSTVTLKPLVVPSGYGGKKIIINVTAVVGSDTITREIRVNVRKDEIE